MKVFFSQPTSKWAKESGYAKRWETFVSNLNQEDAAHSITDNRTIADVVIDTSDEQLDSLTSLLKPLSNENIRHFVWDWGDRPTGRMSGFYCSLDKRLYDHTRHRTVHYPIPFNEHVEEFPQVDARYSFGFVGGITAGLRKRIVDKLKPSESKDNSIIKIQGMDFSKAFDGSPSFLKSDYLAFLRKTKFILCPRGNGLGTVRLFESMKAGRVPVIISDRYPLPSGVDWSNCSVRIKETEIERIPKILESQFENWPQMARNARKNWEASFSNEHFFKYLTNNLEEILRTVPKVNLGRQIEYAAALGVQLADHHLRPVLGHARGVMKI
jgi:hypothetical protein